MTFLAVFGMLFIVAMFGMVINTGYQVSTKVQLQNAVDAGTLSAAGWYARGLNVTSGLSVVQAQLMSAALLLDALSSSSDLVFCDKLLPIFTKACIAGGGLLSAPACFCAWQMGAICIPTMAVISIPLAVIGMQAAYPGGSMWTAIRLIGKFNAGVHIAFGYHFLKGAGGSVAQDVGAPLAVTYLPFPGGWFHGELQYALPTKRATNMANICKAAWDGSKGLQELHDYPAGYGPLRLGRWRLNAMTTAIAGCAGWPVLFSSYLWDKERAVCPVADVEVWELDSSNQKLLVFGMAKASDPRGKLFGQVLFRRPPEKAAFAEVEIYNGISEETFSQDWRVRLKPVSLPWQHLAELQGTVFGRIFQRLTGTSPGSFELVGNH